MSSDWVRSSVPEQIGIAARLALVKSPKDARLELVHFEDRTLAVQGGHVAAFAHLLLVLTPVVKYVECFGFYEA